MQTIVDQLDSKRFMRRSLAALYLDQSFLAGLGNYLRSEILFGAGLHPTLRPTDLSPEQKRRLAQKTIEFCRRSYQTGGKTVTPGPGRGKSDRFWVFARASKHCYNCGTCIRRENFSGRRLYFCPGCQRGAR